VGALNMREMWQGDYCIARESTPVPIEGDELASSPFMALTIRSRWSGMLAYLTALRIRKNLQSLGCLYNNIVVTVMLYISYCVAHIRNLIKSCPLFTTDFYSDRVN
jgi:hypothetical protein